MAESSISPPPDLPPPPPPPPVRTTTDGAGGHDGAAASPALKPAWLALAAACTARTLSAARATFALASALVSDSRSLRWRSAIAT